MIYNTILPGVWALSEHGHDSLPYPMPADTWLWQWGDRWIAHVGAWHTETWWEGASEEDLDARPTHWSRHILDIPKFGALCYIDDHGREVTVDASAFDSFRLSLEGIIHGT